MVFSSDTQPPELPNHPLDDLTIFEMEKASEEIRKYFESAYGKKSSTGIRLSYSTIVLKEPSKDLVLDFTDSQLMNNKSWLTHREAFAVVLLHGIEKRFQLFEVDVRLYSTHPFQTVDPEVTLAVYKPGVQPPLFQFEYRLAERLVKNDPKVKEILAKRGVSDMDKLMVDLWVSFFSQPSRRKGRPLLFYGGYGCPVDGIEVVLDLDEGIVEKVKELFDVPLPAHANSPLSEWKNIKQFRTDLKPLHVVQPEGVSYVVEGSKVSWQNWSFRVGFNKWEGLVLRLISFNDKGKIRPIVYRASCGEMVVPYGDPRHPNYLKNAFDAGEEGLGASANSLRLGCDCLGSVHYFDVQMVNEQGAPFVLKQAICLHEEDAGTLYKHKDWRDGYTEVRRQRRLVVSFFCTIVNYDYGFFWYFYLDGTMKFEAKLTGFLSTSAIKDGESPGGYGTMLGRNLYGPIHQHFFNMRLDMAVDGLNNTVQEVNVSPADPGEYNPFFSAFKYQTSTLFTENEGKRDHNPFAARYWKIVNTNCRNAVGLPTAFKLIPGACIAAPYAQPQSVVRQRAGFLDHSLWVTPFHPKEQHPAGDYTIQRFELDGLPKWTQQNRSIHNTNIVLWYNLGLTHIPRIEDWPVMPVESCAFELKPDGFFDASPAMDIPRTSEADIKHCCKIKAKL